MTEVQAPVRLPDGSEDFRLRSDLSPTLPSGRGVEEIEVILFVLRPSSISPLA